MYYEFEGRQNMKTIIFDDDCLQVGEKSYPYSLIEKMEITSAQLFATYGILSVTMKGDEKDMIIAFPRSYSSKLRRVIHEVEKEQENKLEKQREKIDPVSVMDPYEEVKKLKELYDLDIITEEEFERKKKELLKL